MKKIIYFITIFSAILLPATPAFSISETMLDFYDQNGIYYYNPDGANKNCGYYAGTYDGKASAGLSDVQAAFVDTYHSIAEQLSIDYGIPWETVMAQGILESAAGTSGYATERNNFFGIGAFDSNPDNAFAYETPAAGWQGYYDNIVETPTYREHGVFKEPNITDPYAYSEAITSAGYATTAYSQQLKPLIDAVINRAKSKGWKSSAELAKAHPEMLANAAKNAGGNGTKVKLSDNASICPGQGNGDLNKTALLLAWPERGHDPWNDPKPEYTDALAATGVNKLGDSCSMNGNSCDAFVATVLRYSGVDAEVPCCGASTMLYYFLDHPNLYEEIPNTGNSADLQPGDIRSSEDHIEMFVQAEDGSYRIASASHCDRTADYGINFYPDSSYHIFRRKQ